MAGNAGVLDITDVDDRQVTPVQAVGQFGSSDRGDRRGIDQHELDPGRRYRGVDRQIGRPGLQYRQHRDDRFRGALQKQGYAVSRACALAGQEVRQSVGGVVEFAVRQGPCRRQVTATASGERATCAANNTGTDTGVDAGRVNAARLPIASTRACSSASSRSIEDNRRARVGGHGHDHSLPAARSVFRCWPGRTRRCGIPPSRRSRRAHRPRSSVRTGKTTGPCGRCGCLPASA